MSVPVVLQLSRSEHGAQIDKSLTATMFDMMPVLLELYQMTLGMRCCRRSCQGCFIRSFDSEKVKVGQ